MAKFEDGPVNIELIPVSKGKRIGYTGAEDDTKEKDIEKSEAAFNGALELIYRAAKQVHETVSALEDSTPSEVEVAFHIKLDEDSNAQVVHSGSAAHFHVKLTWEQDD